MYIVYVTRQTDLWVDNQRIQRHVVGDAKCVHVSNQSDALHMVTTSNWELSEWIRLQVHGNQVGVEVETQTH